MGDSANGFNSHLITSAACLIQSTANVIPQLCACILCLDADNRVFHQSSKLFDLHAKDCLAKHSAKNVHASIVG